MPWQSAPSLLIIIGAFNVAAGAMWSIQRIAYGKVRPCKFRVGISPPRKSVGRVGLSLDCCSNFSSSLFSCSPRNVRVVHLLGKKDREILRDQWKYGLETRDLRIEEYRRALAKQGK